MKNRNQISRNSKPTKPAAQPKAATRIVKVRLSREGKTAIENAASKRGLTKSQFAQLAIQREVEKPGEGRIATMTMKLGNFLGLVIRRTGQIETGALVWTREQFDQAVRAGRFLRTDMPREESAPNESRYERFLESLTFEQVDGLRDSVPLYWIDEEPNIIDDGFTVLISYRGKLPDSAPADFGKTAAAMLADRISSLATDIPQDWSEVALIDFSGYLDRDCDERIIYKTPGGELKATRYSDDKRTMMVIEDVTREQVVRWLLECVIPEEFEADFSKKCMLPITRGREGQ